MPLIKKMRAHEQVKIFLTLHKYVRILFLAFHSKGCQAGQHFRL